MLLFPPPPPPLPLPGTAPRNEMLSRGFRAVRGGVEVPEGMVRMKLVLSLLPYPLLLCTEVFAPPGGLPAAPPTYDLSFRVCGSRPPRTLAEPPPPRLVCSNRTLLLATDALDGLPPPPYGMAVVLSPLTALLRPQVRPPAVRVAKLCSSTTVCSCWLTAAFIIPSAVER